MREWMSTHAIGVALLERSHLGHGQTVLEIHIFALDISCDLVVLVPLSLDFEGDVGRCEGLDL